MRAVTRLASLPFQLPDEEHDLSDRELELDDSTALSDLRWQDPSADALSPQPSSNPSLSLPQPLRSERSGRDTPASVDSIPLEWDHDYDLSRDLESAVSRTLPSEDEEGREDKEFYLRGAVGLSGRTALPGCQLGTRTCSFCEASGARGAMSLWWLRKCNRGQLAWSSEEFSSLKGRDL